MLEACYRAARSGIEDYKRALSLGTSRLRKLASRLLFSRPLRGALLLLLICSFGAHGAETQREKFALSIAQQRLDLALQELARQCDIQVIFLWRFTQGLTAPAVQGDLTVADALSQLLDGSPLTFHVINPQTVEIRPRQAQANTPSPKPEPVASNRPKRTDETARLEEVVVTGVAEQLVATRVPTPIWQLPQSVAIISSEQIRLQNSVDLGDALRRAAGVTLTRSSSLDGDFYMRGYIVPTLQSMAALH